LFFIFKEIDNIVTKSILKNGGQENRGTKKVRLSPEEYIEKKKKSLKKMIRRAKTTRKNLA
jgi:predicted metal-binding transcription factor (methanogenesis marker protein 9)